MGGREGGGEGGGGWGVGERGWGGGWGWVGERVGGGRERVVITSNSHSVQKMNAHTSKFQQQKFQL